jgi:MSHA biogenesis protein MshJ
MTMRAQLNQAARTFNNRGTAEKLVLAVLLIGVLLFVFDTFYYSGAAAERESLQRRIDSSQLLLGTLEQREQTALATAIQAPNEAIRIRIERAMAEQAALDSDIEALTGNLVTPQSMTRVLTSILESQQGLDLLRVENRAPQALRVMTGDSSGSTVFRHTLLLEMEGDFLSLIGYLLRLENFPEHFFWDQLTFRQTTWPRARISLELHTLSTAEGFVGV